VLSVTVVQFPAVVRPEFVFWLLSHSLCLAPVNPDWFYQNGSAFLVPAYPGCPEKKAVK